MTMLCDEFQAHVGDPMDSPNSLRLARHLADCPKCAAWYDSHEELLGQRLLVVEVAPPRTFTEDRLSGGLVARIEWDDKSGPRIPS